MLNLPFIKPALITLLLLQLAACASGPWVRTDGTYERATPAEAAQRTADEYRRAGASGAATQAQARADCELEAERKEPGRSFVAALLDSLFDSLFGAAVDGRASQAGAGRR